MNLEENTTKETKPSNPETVLKIFLIAIAFVGLAGGFSDAILANYFKEAYAVNAAQRGFIEFPRELPGVLSFLFLAWLSALGNVRNAVLAQLLGAAGLVVLGFFRPSYAVMLVFLFIFSTGVHMFLPLGDSIGLSLAQRMNMGRIMGRINSVRMTFLMLSGVLTFVGFRVGWFDFELPAWVFIIGAACFFMAGALLVAQRRIGGALSDGPPVERAKFVFRKAYLRYYLICAVFGGRKQIMLVYSPWVLIDLLDFKADTISILAVVGSLIGIFFMPVVGRWIDCFGIRRVMTAEALAFVAVYIAYGFLSRWVNNNVVALTGIGMMFVYLLNIVDRMSAQFSMVRSIYMRSIALAPEDVTPSLTLGMAIDHVVAIVGSYVCGLVWFRWGPEFVFLIAGVLSLANLIAAQGIKENY
ncbi:MAG: MFS transporter [Clostridiales Family XIII bacterium]|jgi:predicted MFS family arabinose efflux permease|nr:MFS transporter [Clostridiales Family XIII bacterium]